MLWKILLVIFVIIIVISLYGLKDKKKLERLERKLNRTWESINDLILERFEIGIKANKDDKKIIKMLNNFKKIDKKDFDTIIDSYYKYNKYLKRLSLTPKYKKLLSDNYEAINKLRIHYNNDALKITNLVKIIPLNIYAKMFGYKKWIYFRNEE